jgi:hypothetical protein
MHDIFISYSRQDARIITQISRVLEACGWPCFIDRNIEFTCDWQQAIDRALASSPVVLACWSRASIKSDYVLYESRTGLAAGKLVSVLLDEVELPGEYDTQQAVDLVRWQGDPDDSQLRRLIEFLWNSRLFHEAQSGAFFTETVEVKDVLFSTYRFRGGGWSGYGAGFGYVPHGLAVGKGGLTKRIKIKIFEDHATVLINPGVLSGFASRRELEARLWRSGPKSLLRFCDEHGEYKVQLRQEAKRPFLRPPFLKGRYYDPEIQRFVPSIDFYHGRP